MTQPQPSGTVEGGTIRPAVAADLPIIEWIEQASFAEPWPQAAFRRHLDAAVFLVFERQSGPIAGFILGDRLGPQNGGIGHIKDFAVAPQYRGQGIGTQLLTRTLTAFASQGLQTATLEVRVSNTTARRLYERFGFTQLQIREEYYRDGEDAVVMVANLQAEAAGD